MVDLSCEDVHKKYRIRKPADAAQTRARWIPRLWSRWPAGSEFWALRGVNFKVECGEALGIIGPNGAGKTTVLKLLSRITAPTKGRIRVRGRLAALIEVSAGFHNELTGRENIYLSGSILGMSRPEISRKLDSIVEFSGLREFLEVPVKRYSTGMYLRLGFAIAAHLEPDILLLDEVLAVGDLAFQAKCQERIAQLRQSGVTLVVISHDLGAVERLCDRVLLLQHGALIDDGRPKDVIARYVTLPIAQAGSGNWSSAGKPAACTGLSFRSGIHGRDAIRTGDPLIARVDYEARERVTGVTFNLLFWWQSGYLCAQLSTALDGAGITLEAGKGYVEFSCPTLAMQPGMYRVDASLARGSSVIDQHERCSILRVDPGKVVLGDFYMPHTWQLVPERLGVLR